MFIPVNMNQNNQAIGTSLQLANVVRELGKQPINCGINSKIFMKQLSQKFLEKSFKSWIKQKKNNMPEPVTIFSFTYSNLIISIMNPSEANEMPAFQKAF